MPAPSAAASWCPSSCPADFMVASIWQSAGGNRRSDGDILVKRAGGRDVVPHSLAEQYSRTCEGAPGVCAIFTFPARGQPGGGRAVHRGGETPRAFLLFSRPDYSLAPIRQKNTRGARGRPLTLSAFHRETRRWKAVFS